MIEMKGYRYLQLIYETQHSLIYRCIRHQDRLPAVLKVLKNDYPSPLEIFRLQREFDMIRSLDLKGVIRGIDSDLAADRPVLVLEDFGGESLKILFDSGHWSLSQNYVKDILKLSIQMVDALGGLHAEGVIHKDINPSNLVYNPETEVLKIIDFGIASRLPRERIALKNPSVLEGTLAFISPEQTGRMNHPLDYRSDFYSLGVSLYWMFSGRLPFETADPVELVHAHIARKPAPLHTLSLSDGFPEPLSAIVMKLLSKMAEERYLSAWGLRRDLEKCLEPLEIHDTIPEFVLGEEDAPHRLLPPRKIIGRDPEIQKLKDTLNRIQKGAVGLTLISGYSGVGKTVLVKECFRAAEPETGYFISGKFDQHQYGTPFSAVSAAFGELAELLLTETEERLDGWRKELSEAAGPNGRVLLDVIPEFESVMGPQPPVPELSPSESRNRFNLTFMEVVRVFCRPPRFLAVFLDDLQWADAGTLDMMEMFASQGKGLALFIIGAFRDSETGPDHPLTRLIRRLVRKKTPLDHIRLGPLKRDTVGRIIAESLHLDTESVAPLTERIMRKTGGNPFFINEFLKTLYQEELLTFVPPEKEGRGKWIWDTKKIDAARMTDNVADLLIRKLSRFPKPVRFALKMGACMGNRFDLDTLAVISRKTSADILETLTPAVEAELIYPVSEPPSGRTGTGETGGNASGKGNGPSSGLRTVSARFKFLHDRIQQAAYALIEPDQRECIHFEIGRLLLENTPESDLHLRIFDIVEQFNQGISASENPPKDPEIARLNLRAGERAKSASAFGASLRYFEIGCSLLPPDAWESEYELTFRLNRELAEAQYLNGDFKASEARIHSAMPFTGTDIEKADLYYLLIVQHAMSGKYEAAIQEGIAGLALMGVEFPERAAPEIREAEFEKAVRNLGNREIADLIRLPRLKDPKSGMALKLLSCIAVPTYLFNPDLYILNVLVMVNLALEKGLAPEMAYGFSAYGMLLCFLKKDYHRAYEFGRLAVAVSEKYESRNQKCIACNNFGGCLIHWTRPMREIEDVTREGWRAGLESGELQYAGFNLIYRLFPQFSRGCHLDELEEKIAGHLEFTRKTRNLLATDAITAVLLTIRNLTGRTERHDIFETGEMSEADFLASCREHQSDYAVCIFHIFKSQALYLYGDMEAALISAEKAEKMISYIPGTLPVVEQTFYHALILAGIYDRTPPSRKEAVFRKIEELECRLKEWAENSPENFNARYWLVAAEKARIRGDRLEQIMALYDYAVIWASENDFINLQALGNERAGAFWAGIGKNEFAALHIRRAYYAYRLWGASGKLAHLQTRYPRITLWMKRKGSALSTATSGIPSCFHSDIGTDSEIDTEAVADLDLASMIRATQAISREIRFDRLLERLLKILMENAGAERVYLILEKNGVFHLEAGIKADSEAVTFYEDVPVETSRDLSGNVIAYVARTRTGLILDDAGREGPFVSDPLIRNRRIRSLLCVPLMNLGRITGMLWMENRLVRGAFTGDHLQMLEILSAQAAVSIDNARLYRSLEASENKYRSLYEEAVEGIFQTTPDGRVISANPALCRIIGYASPEELMNDISDIGTDLYVRQEDRSRIVSGLNEEGKIVGFETQLYRKDRSIFWCSISARAVRKPDGCLRCYEGSLTDITARKEKEKAERAMETAEAANRAKSEFLANLSHEIRTPMNAILGFTDIMLSQTADAGFTGYLNTIRSSGQTLMTLINDILDLSKIEAGKLDTRLDIVEIRYVVTETAHFFMSRTEDRDVEIITEIPDNIPPLKMDEVRLRQILTNLVGNAVKFTHKGYVKVAVSAGFASPPKTSETDASDFRHLTLTVEDTGIGIPKGQEEEIFKSFHQTRKNQAFKYGGTGLGLSITRNLVELMGGNVSVESKLGRGSLFTVDFPAVEVAPAPQPDTSVNGGDVPNVRFEASRILVVDDIDYNRDLIRQYLSDTDLTFMEACNGQEALEMIRMHVPTLVLMDLRMPEMDGYRAAEILTKDEALSKIPLIAMTASTMKSRDARLQKLFDGFLIKPVSRGDLTSELKKYLPWSPRCEETASEKEKPAFSPAHFSEKFPLSPSPLLNGVIEKLETTIMDRWKETREIMFLDELSAFAEELKAMARNSGIELLAAYSGHLLQATRRIDIEEIEKYMAMFPEVVEILKKASVTEKQVF